MDMLLSFRSVVNAISIFGFILCVNTTSASTRESKQNVIDLSPSQLQENWKGDLDGMIDRRMIRVLTPYNKTYFFIDKGTPRGIVHDTFVEFEKEINFTVAKNGAHANKNIKVRVIFIPMARDKLLNALNEGKGDIVAANMTVTPQRKKNVSFSIPVYSHVNEILLSSPDSKRIHNIKQLSGKEIFVRRSSSYYDSLVKINNFFKRESLPPAIIIPAPESLEDEDLIEMLNAGLISNIIVDQHLAAVWRKVFPNIHFQKNIILRRGAAIAWATRKEDVQLLHYVNKFIKKQGVGHKFGNTILIRYLKNNQYVRDASNTRERKRFLSMVDLFKKYGRVYDIDWILVAAQGYQESRLNQSARNATGAVGVMQIMPKTGRALNVGNIRDLEPNIHAGFKYLRMMIDRYYRSKKITTLDKILFTFASYNAGPARIIRIRSEAKKQGFDPNIWFGNVEYLAADDIGTETVNYVGNIYKYYIAYKLIAEEIERKKTAVAKSKK